MEHNFSGQIDKDKWNEIISEWEKICDKRELKRIRKTPMIMSLYKEHFQSVVAPSKYQQMASQLRGKIAEELRNTLDNDQRQLLEQWEEYEDMVIENKIQEAYVYGFFTGSTIRSESIREYKRYRSKRSKRYDR